MTKMERTYVMVVNGDRTYGVTRKTVEAMFREMMDTGGRFSVVPDGYGIEGVTYGRTREEAEQAQRDVGQSIK